MGWQKLYPKPTRSKQSQMPQVQQPPPTRHKRSQLPGVQQTSMYKHHAQKQQLQSPTTRGQILLSRFNALVVPKRSTQIVPCGPTNTAAINKELHQERMEQQLHQGRKEQQHLVHLRHKQHLGQKQHPGHLQHLS